MCFNYYFGGSWKSFCGVSEPSWQCGMSITDIRDGKSYNTVKIFNQCWMAENLNIGLRADGMQGENPAIPASITIMKYCYSDNEAYCDTFGGLYQWAEAMQYSTTPGVQGICPAGWHIPTDEEWTTLTDTLGGLGEAGGEMKSTGTLQAGTGFWSTPNEGATNISGFTGFPGGYYKNTTSSFINLHLQAYHWTSTQHISSSTQAWSRHLKYDTDDAFRIWDMLKTYGLSVRCLKD